MPPPPLWLSTMIDCPSPLPRRSATRRATSSTPPPGCTGAMILIGLLGQASSATAHAGAHNSAMPASRVLSVVLRFICVSSNGKIEQPLFGGFDVMCHQGFAIRRFGKADGVEDGAVFANGGFDASARRQIGETGQVQFLHDAAVDLDDLRIARGADDFPVEAQSGAVIGADIGGGGRLVPLRPMRVY